MEGNPRHFHGRMFVVEEAEEKRSCGEYYPTRSHCLGIARRGNKLGVLIVREDVNATGYMGHWWAWTGVVAGHAKPDIGILTVETWDDAVDSKLGGKAPAAQAYYGSV